MAQTPSHPIKSYIFSVVVEPDEDRWHAYAPALSQYAAATWGYTREEALKNIQELVEMVVEELIEDGIAIPEEPKEEVEVVMAPRVLVTI
jgi:predicted RNase H-like HicB family nuclease